MNIFKIAKSYIKNKNQNGLSKFHSWLAITGIAIGVTAFIVVSSAMSGVFDKLYNDINIINNYDISIINYKEKDLETVLSIIGKENIKKEIFSKKLSKGYKSKIFDKNININITENDYFEDNFIYFNNSLHNIEKKAVFIKLEKDEKIIDQDLFPIKILSNEQSRLYPIGVLNPIMTKKTFESSFFDQYEYVTVLNIKLNNFMDSFETYSNLQAVFPEYEIESWFSNNKKLFENLTIESSVIKIVLFFIILVSSFSVMSTITLIISEKKQDIFVLKTIGYSNNEVLSIFLISGLLIGLLGILIGLVLGTIISLNIREILLVLESLLNTNMFPSYLKEFPLDINYYDYIKISLLTFFIILLSSLIPAYKTVSISPAEGLKSE